FESTAKLEWFGTKRPHPPSAPSPASQGKGKHVASAWNPSPACGGRWRQPEGGKSQQERDTCSRKSTSLRGKRPHSLLTRRHFDRTGTDIDHQVNFGLTDHIRRHEINHVAE